VYFRQLINDNTACASYLLGSRTHTQLAVVDPHAGSVDECLAPAAGQDAPIVALLETHVQADHVSGLPELIRRAGATAYLPADAGVGFEHHGLADGERVHLGKHGDRSRGHAWACCRTPQLSDHRPHSDG